MVRKTLLAALFALTTGGLIGGVSWGVDEGGVADGARPATKPSSAEREAILATQPSWLRPGPSQQTSAARAATRPSPHTQPATQPGKRPVEAIRHVLVLSIDGLRPDLLLLADAPNARK